ncbi:MAG TPA: NTP transferase domain-containing protein [Myxococcota bacterium]|nr:NTP transferase domain-containing protein [Myxococcota bacterium]
MEKVVTAVILCAGGSRRMGHPKGLLPLDGSTLLRVQVERFLAAGLPVRVVLGSRAREHFPQLPPGVEVELNFRWATTDMATSAAPALRGTVLLQPVDVPPPTPDSLARLLACTGDAVPRVAGQDGHPVRLEAPHPPGRLDHRLRHAARVEVEDPDCTLNLNHPADWEAWRRRYTPHATAGKKRA